MPKIQIDFNRIIGKIKPLHGVNNSPVSFWPGDDPMKELAAAGIPYVRLHDTAGAYGGSHYVDIPNVFPDFDANPDDPEAYDFAFTDAYLKQMTAAGLKPFYRLGVTIENFYRIKAYNIDPPKDFEKWASICEGIIRHYNEGWADGFHWGIEYWEIWNEPENPPMWSGTREQFFELYRTTANRLKQRFPNIRIGGYGSCGFYAVTDPDATEFYKSFVTYFDDFLAYVTDSATSAPLDFFSWHLYANDPQLVARHAEHVDSRLKKYGLERTENIFNEWNYADHKNENMFDRMKEMPGAAYVASVLCLMQSLPVDKAMYYDALPSRTYCGLFYFPSRRVTKTYYSLLAFNELYRLKGAVGVYCNDVDPEIYSCAATDGEDTAVVIANNGSSPCDFTLSITGTSKPMQSYLLDSNSLMGKDRENITDGNEMTIAPLSVILLHSGTPFKVVAEKAVSTSPVNGLEDSDE